MEDFRRVLDDIKRLSGEGKRSVLVPSGDVRIVIAAMQEAIAHRTMRTTRSGNKLAVK